MARHYKKRMVIAAPRKASLAVDPESEGKTAKQLRAEANRQAAEQQQAKEGR